MTTVKRSLQFLRGVTDEERQNASLTKGCMHYNIWRCGLVEMNGRINTCSSFFYLAAVTDVLVLLRDTGNLTGMENEINTRWWSQWCHLSGTRCCRSRRFEENVLTREKMCLDTSRVTDSLWHGTLHTIFSCQIPDLWIKDLRDSGILMVLEKNVHFERGNCVKNPSVAQQSPCSRPTNAK